MSTISHKNLTGNQVHEPKGADTAAINKVYVSDGAGSGAWQKLTASQLQTTGNPFGAQLIYVREEQTNGTTSTTSSDGSIAASEDATIVLNTSVTNEISGASLASNQITLPSGTYYAKGFVPNTGGGFTRARAKFYNATDAADLISGSGVQSGSAPVFVEGRFTLSGTKAVELRVKPNGTFSMAAASLSTTEIYGQVWIWKVL